MSLSSREAFKFGFLARCADDGLDDAGIAARVATANQLLCKSAQGVGTAASAIAKLTGGLGFAGVLAALTGGGVLGHATARMREPYASLEDAVEEAQQEELIAAYQQAAQQAAAQARRVKYRDPRAGKPRPPKLI